MGQDGYAQATIESATQYLTLFWRIAIAKGYLVHGVASSARTGSAADLERIRH